MKDAPSRKVKMFYCVKARAEALDGTLHLRSGRLPCAQWNGGCRDCDRVNINRVEVLTEVNDG